MPERKCEICGADMTGRVKSARFCIDCASRRQSEQAAMYRKMKKKPKLCSRCGKEIIGRGKYSKLCSVCVNIPSQKAQHKKHGNPCYGCEHFKYDGYAGKYCNYYFDTGKSRNCDPEDCRKFGRYQINVKRK